MRICPTVEGVTTPLITHRISAGACLERQEAHFHKCHRCVYRGKPVDWVAPQPDGADAVAARATARRKAKAKKRKVTPAKEAEAG